jgi:hypothetical protein
MKLNILFPKKLKFIKFLVIPLFIMISFNVTAQFADEGYYQPPDQENLLLATRIGRGTEYHSDPVELVKKLTYLFEDPCLKYKAIYSWIAFHIKYDFEGLEDRSKLDSDPLVVLDSLKTICGGYSALMCFLCKLAGLECEYIIGWSKTTPDNLAGIIWAIPDHAWNAIKINDVWRYCDTTWGAGYGKKIRIGHGKDAVVKEIFVPHYTSAYFAIPVEKIFLQHYPLESRWQNEYCMTKEEFDAQPLYDRSFFTNWINGLYFQNKWQKMGFLSSIWLKFNSKTEIYSVSIGGKQIAMPFLRLGNNYLCCITPGKKRKPFNVILNNNAVLTYINK